MHTAEIVLAAGLKKAHKQRGKAQRFRWILRIWPKRYVHPPAYARLDQSNQIQFLKCCVPMVGSLIQCIGWVDFVHGESLLRLREDIVPQVKGYLETLFETDFVLWS